MKVKIKYHSSDLIKIETNPNGDWIDLRSDETICLTEGDYVEISLGISMELPKGYELNIVPRSSTFKNWGILQTNSFGIIDNSYCGNNDILKMPVYATRATTINKNDRICQFRINKTMTNMLKYEYFLPLIFEEVELLGTKDRGGLGSSGKK